MSEESTDANNPAQHQHDNHPSDDRNGSFLDSMWCCKVCDGDIPDGHTNNCDIWKLEKKHRDFLANEYNTVLLERDEMRRLLSNAIGMAEFGDINADMEDDGIGWKEWYVDTRKVLAPHDAAAEARAEVLVNHSGSEIPGMPSMQPDLGILSEPYCRECHSLLSIGHAIDCPTRCSNMAHKRYGMTGCTECETTAQQRGTEP